MLTSRIAEQNNVISFKSNKPSSLQDLSNEDLVHIANMPDEYIKASTQRDEARKFMQQPMRKTEKRVSQAIPIADTLLTAALTPGNFGDKVFAGLGRAVDWTVFVKITDGLANKMHKNETYRNFSQNHPLAASLASTVVLTTAGVIGYTAVQLGFNKLVNSYKPLQRFLKSAHTDLKNMTTGKKIVKFLAENTKYIKAGAIAGAVGVGAIVLNSLMSVAKLKKNTDNKTEQYKNLRLEAAKELNNRLLNAQSQQAE